MRAIDADALLKKDEWLTWDGDSYNVVHVIDVLCAPTLDVEPVRHGYWIEGRDGSCMCSECGKVSRYEIGYYCSNCGAKMDLPN